MSTPQFEQLWSGQILRMAKVSESFPPGSPKPLPAHFAPSSTEREKADQAQTPVMISVWDRDRTTERQARQIGPQHGEYVGFWLDVESVSAVRVPAQECEMTVVRDPLGPPQVHQPGADGHCGLTGLGRAENGNKNARYQLKFRLAELAKPSIDP